VKYVVSVTDDRNSTVVNALLQTCLHVKWWKSMRTPWRSHGFQI